MRYSSVYMFLLCCFLVSAWAVDDVKPYDVVDDTPFNLLTFMCGRKIYIVYNWVAGGGGRGRITLIVDDPHFIPMPSFDSSPYPPPHTVSCKQWIEYFENSETQQKWIKWKMLKCWWKSECCLAWMEWSEASKENGKITHCILNEKS